MVRTNQAYLDVVGLAVLALVASGTALFLPDWRSPVRVVLGFAFVLVAPGYALTTALFPKKGELAGAERLALCLGLSTAVVPLLGLLLNYTPWGIRLVPVTFSLTLFVCLMIGLILYRRHHTAPEAQFRLAASHPQARTTLWALLATGLALAGVVVAAQALRPVETFTEFYLLGSEGKLEGYPTELTPGETFRLTLGVNNHEGEEVAYNVRLPQGAVTNVPALKDGESWEQSFTLTAPEGRGKTKLAFDLYREGSEQPYRSLHLYVTLTPREDALSAAPLSYPRDVVPAESRP